MCIIITTTQINADILHKSANSKRIYISSHTCLVTSLPLAHSCILPFLSLSMCVIPVTMHTDAQLRHILSTQLKTLLSGHHQQQMYFFLMYLCFFTFFHPIPRAPTKVQLFCSTFVFQTFVPLSHHIHFPEQVST